MEIGPISEWLAAISEFLAVCVALLLPYYTDRKNTKRKRRNICLGIKRLANQALAHEEDAIKNLELFLTISFISNDDATTEKLLMSGQEILQAIKNLPAEQDADYQTKVADVKQLIAQIPSK